MNKTLKILLYKPSPSKQTIRMERLICCEPLELEYLFTILNDYDVHLVDGMIKRTNPLLLVKKLKPDIVLITSYITNIEMVKEISNKIKVFSPNIKIFVGGPHAEVIPEHFKSNYIDGIIYRNHLIAIKTIIDAIHSNKSYIDTPGFAYNKNNRLIKNDYSKGSNNFPIPNRTFFNKHINKYKYLYFNDCASIKTSYGCPGKCSFCFCRKMNNNKFFERSIEDVVNEIESITTNNIFILDDNFLVNKKRLIKFYTLIKKRNINKNYIAYGTANFIANNKDIMIMLKEIGFEAVIVGFEFINNSQLNKVNKGTSQFDNNATIDLCNKLGIELFALFICSSNWKHKDFYTLAKYINSKKLTFATFSTETNFPDSESYDNLEFNNTKFWRYDLLRLHCKPKYISSISYYFWLYLLYLLPFMRFSSIKKILKHYGFLGSLRVFFISCIICIEYFLKLLIWR